MGTREYSEALGVAIGAAERAAAFLLAECAREGGPRGTVGHCPADEEAEAAIRAILTDAFPTWGYRGEETAYQRPEAGETHVWVVDPNDGTEAMQQGHRGSAVSIALLRGGVPVLGVVHAVNAPDDEGDRFAWAEGCGPLTRNGKPIEHGPWPTKLVSTDIVLVSHAADRHPVGNLACVSPARFRAAPSIAYRLALVAAGEGVVAVSLNGPTSWDYAAGHALLRAVGGSFLNQASCEISYTLDGQSSALHVFGGAPGPAIELSKRDWHLVRNSGFGRAKPPAQFAAVPVGAGNLVHDTAMLQRAQGCMLGQLAGDALGSLVEFEDPTTIARRYSDGPRLLKDGGTWDTIAGQPTDDSELTLMLARALVWSGFDIETIAHSYGRWYHGWAHDDEPTQCDHSGCRPFDIGGTTRQALSAITPEAVRSGVAAKTANRAVNLGSQANGALMRISPLGIWGANQPVEVVADGARQDARLTHPNPVCVDASAVYAVTIAHAIATGGSPGEVYAWALDWSRSNYTEPSITAALEAAAAKPPSSYTHQEGWVLIAL